jgi:putative membrane protein
MIYPIIKALHLVSVFLFVGGLLAGALQLASASPAPAGTVRNPLQWHRHITTAAMFGAWTFGLMLAELGHWFPAPWLIIKLALVLALSALHGVLTGRLRRVEASLATSDDTAFPWAGVVMLLVAGIVFLAVLKMPAT